jgi:hypothetical protein
MFWIQQDAYLGFMSLGQNCFQPHCHQAQRPFLLESVGTMIDLGLAGHWPAVDHEEDEISSLPHVHHWRKIVSALEECQSSVLHVASHVNTNPQPSVEAGSSNVLVWSLALKH